MAAKYTTSQYSENNLAAILAIPRAELPDPASNIYPILMAADTGIIYKFDPDSTTIGVLPTGASGAGRWIAISTGILQANRTYYASPSGSDGNTGLSAASPVTFQGGISLLTRVNTNGFVATLQLADGTYNLSDSIFLSLVESSGKRIIQGNSTNPSNVIVQASANWSKTGLFYCTGGGWEIKGMQIKSGGFNSVSTQGSALIAVDTGGNLRVGNNVYSLATGLLAHLWVLYGGLIDVIDNYSISGGGCNCHVYGNANGFFRCQSKTITITGSPAFATASVKADYQGIVVINGCTFNGAATGQRYLADSLGQIIAIGGANYIFGDTAGAVTNGGQYI